ncbi:MAG: hypothetical protein AAF481_05890 [Acidobacteriota bacterium]
MLLLGILVPLGVRSLVTDDSRYGWGTFGRQTIYTLTYLWEFEDGRREIYEPGDELRDDARKLLDSPRQRNTRYGPGAIPIWIRAYGRYMWERRPAEARAFHAVLRYEFDKSRRLELSDAAASRSFRYPEETSEP